MKRLVVVLALVGAGCTAAAPVPAPREAPGTPLFVLEQGGEIGIGVVDHYDDVNQITLELFDEP